METLDQEKQHHGLNSAERSREDAIGEIIIAADAPHQHTKRNIGPISIVALAFNICNSWAGLSSSLAIAIGAGGPVTVIYGLLIAFIMYLAVAISLAELASVYPTAGGQYHFTSILAPSRYSKGLSYSCGIIATTSWVFICAAINLLCAQLILALPTYLIEGHIEHTWHTFLVYQAINVFSLLYNLFALQKTLWIHDIGFILSLVTFTVTTVTCLVLSTKQPSSYVWTTFNNSTGWPSGVTFLTGLATPCFAFVGIDASLHLAEECTAPQKTVPRALISTICIGFITGFVFSVAMCYGITDLDTILAANLPIYALWEQATQSLTAATIFVTALFVIFLFVAIAVQQTTSHMIWAFARDNGLVFSEALATMHPTLQVPAWALLANALLVTIIGCIYLGSVEAFNALINTPVILQIVSYAIPVALLMLQRRSSDLLPTNRAFRVPEWLGWTANILTVVFAIVQVFVFDMPSSIPVTAETMNYTPVVLVFVGLLGIANWVLHAKKVYCGPRITYAQ